MDELQPVLGLSDYQRIHTRIYLQTVLGETEVLVNSRPNYTTERNIDYVGIPDVPRLSQVVSSTSRLLLLSTGFMSLLAILLGIFIAIEFVILRPRIITLARLGVQFNPNTLTPAIIS